MITGSGPPGGSLNAFVQNGIQISDGATADVNHNTISDNEFLAAAATGAPAATGILLFQSGEVTIDHNMLSSNDVGIYVFDVGSFFDVPVIGSAEIDHNQVTGSTYDGILLYLTAGADINHNTTDGNGSGGFGDGGIVLFSSQNNTIDHNESSNNNGVGIGVVDQASTGNTFDHNQMSGNALDAADGSLGTGTAGTGNTWTKNQGTTSNRPGLFS
jgi:parallel beta-helix repeat protein